MYEQGEGIASENQRCMNEVKQLTADFALMLELQRTTKARLDQLQATLEVQNQTPEVQDGSSRGTPHQSHNTEGNRSFFQVCSLKVDFPQFTGTNALQWIC